MGEVLVVVGGGVLVVDTFTADGLSLHQLTRHDLNKQAPALNGTNLPSDGIIQAVLCYEAAKPHATNTTIGGCCSNIHSAI
jgi:hypothetical protein